MKEIELGQVVRCKVSGFTGTATAYKETIFGSDQIVIQAFNESGNVCEDSYAVDVAQIEHVLHVGEIQVMIGATPATRTSDIKLGDEVRDKVTGYKGVVTAIYTWLNGCIHFMVETRKIKDGVPDSLRDSEQRWELTDKDVLKLTPAEEEKKAKGPGGPSHRMPSQRI